jgi:hypothetical protein
MCSSPPGSHSIELPSPISSPEITGAAVSGAGSCSSSLQDERIAIEVKAKKNTVVLNL